jgi:hypothetical protein
MAIESVVITIAAGVAGLALVIYASRRGWIGGAGQMQISSITSVGSASEEVRTISEPQTPIQAAPEPAPVATTEIQPTIEPVVEEYVQPPQAVEEIQPYQPVEVVSESILSPEPTVSVTIPEVTATPKTRRAKPKSRATRKTTVKRRSRKKVKAR